MPGNHTFNDYTLLDMFWAANRGWNSSSCVNVFVGSAASLTQVMRILRHKSFAVCRSCWVDTSLAFSIKYTHHNFGSSWHFHSFPLKPRYTSHFLSLVQTSNHRPTLSLLFKPPRRRLPDIQPTSTRIIVESISTLYLSFQR